MLKYEMEKGEHINSDRKHTHLLFGFICHRTDRSWALGLQSLSFFFLNKQLNLQQEAREGRRRNNLERSTFTSRTSNGLTQTFTAGRNGFLQLWFTRGPSPLERRVNKCHSDSLAIKSDWGLFSRTRRLAGKTIFNCHLISALEVLGFCNKYQVNMVSTLAGGWWWGREGGREGATGRLLSLMACPLRLYCSKCREQTGD